MISGIGQSENNWFQDKKAGMHTWALGNTPPHPLTSTIPRSQNIFPKMEVGEQYPKTQTLATLIQSGKREENELISTTPDTLHIWFHWIPSINVLHRVNSKILGQSRLRPGRSKNQGKWEHKWNHTDTITPSKNVFKKSNINLILMINIPEYEGQIPSKTLLGNTLLSLLKLPLYN